VARFHEIHPRDGKSPIGCGREVLGSQALFLPGRLMRFVLPCCSQSPAESSGCAQACRGPLAYRGAGKVAGASNALL
jgi:hypothetical protein